MLPAASPPSEAHSCREAGVRIGVFDSGLGGLSILRAIRQYQPESTLIYVADSGHAPYGERDDDFIRERALCISQFLTQEQGVDLIVVACNTATAVAVHALRERHPQLPIVGVEPGVKPAAACSRNGRIGVLATPLTLASEKYQRLISTHGQNVEVVQQACPGLAKEIEGGDLDTPRLRELVEAYARPLREADVDTAVLGCTHYPFVAPLFREALGPQVHLIDTAEAVARQTLRRSAELLASARSLPTPLLTTPSLTPSPAAPLAPCVSLSGALTSAIPGQTSFWTTGDPAHLRAVAGAWLAMPDPQVQALQATTTTPTSQTPA